MPQPTPLQTEYQAIGLRVVPEKLFRLACVAQRLSRHVYASQPRSIARARHKHPARLPTRANHTCTPHLTPARVPRTCGPPSRALHTRVARASVPNGDGTSPNPTFTWPHHVAHSTPHVHHATQVCMTAQHTATASPTPPTVAILPLVRRCWSTAHNSLQRLKQTHSNTSTLNYTTRCLPSPRNSCSYIPKQMTRVTPVQNYHARYRCQSSSSARHLRPNKYGATLHPATPKQRVGYPTCLNGWPQCGRLMEMRCYSLLEYSTRLRMVALLYDSYQRRSSLSTIPNVGI